MAVENFPVWSVLPNWQNGLTERLEWKTGVLASPSGAEQRFSARNTPRRSWDISFMESGPHRAWVDNALSAVGVSPWYVPVWNDLSVTTAAISSGATSITVDTAGRDFRVGGYIMLRASVFDAKVHEIISVSPTAIGITPAADRTWTPGTLLCPAVPARMAEMPTLSRQADRTATFRARFEVIGPSLFALATLSEDYLGYPVMTTPPNESDDLTTEHARLLAEFSTDAGRRLVDVSGRNFTVQRHRWLVQGRAQQDALRSYLYALRGRRVATWVPTFAADFDLAASALSSATTIDVTQCGFTRFGGPRFGRGVIRIEPRVGAAIHRTITDSDDLGATERLTLDSSLGVALSPGGVRRISFMPLARLDQDGIELVHYTDKAGAMAVTASFRSTSDVRSATAYEPTPFANTEELGGLCGFFCGS